MKSQKLATLKPLTSPTKMMSNGRIQFFNLVKAMREAQNIYFRNRTQANLDKARALERQVDAQIRRGDEYLKQQKEPSLFD